MSDAKSTNTAAPAGPAPVLFRHAIEPRWRDLDAFGHVNNSNFLTYLEESRIQWFRTLGRESLHHLDKPRYIPRYFADLHVDRPLVVAQGDELKSDIVA